MSAACWKELKNGWMNEDDPPRLRHPSVGGDPPRPSGTPPWEGTHPGFATPPWEGTHPGFAIRGRGPTPSGTPPWEGIVRGDLGVGFFGLCQQVAHGLHDDVRVALEPFTLEHDAPFRSSSRVIRFE
jgi:hypothetical protein